MKQSHPVPKTIAIFDDLYARGHFIDFSHALARTALAAGHPVVLYTPREPQFEEAEARHLTWMATPDLTRSDDRVEAAAIRGRAAPSIVADCRRRGVDLFIDTNLDEHFPIAMRLRRAAPRTVFIVHHRVGVIRTRPSLRQRGRVRIVSRRTVQRMNRGGARLVVHTAASGDALHAEAGVRAVVAPYPVLVPDGLQPGAIEAKEGQLLFPGMAEPYKGWPTLVEALAHVGGSLDLVVAGKQADRSAAQPSRIGAHRVHWIDEALPRRTLLEEFCRAELVVLPHAAAFGEAGWSGTLAEALMLGRPTIVSSALSAELPPGYHGAVIFRADDPTDLAAAINDARQRLPELRAGAAAGPAAVSNRSMAEYFNTLLNASCRQ